MIQKIISGGQTGADFGGLKAAKILGIPTGGWMPKGYLTQNGNKPIYAQLYNIQEHISPKYPPRTYQNVKESDGTVRFAIHWDSAGENCTLNAIKQYNKVWFDVHVIGTTQPTELREWLIANNIKILNVAGNSERTAPGIEEFVVAFLLEALSE